MCDSFVFSFAKMCLNYYLFHLSRFVSMKILFEQLLFTFFTYLQVFSFKVAIQYFHFKLSFGLKISSACAYSHNVKNSSRYRQRKYLYIFFF